MKKRIWIGVVIVVLGGGLLLLRNAGLFGNLAITYVLVPLGIALALWLGWTVYGVSSEAEAQPTSAADLTSDNPVLDELMDHFAAAYAREKPCPYCGETMERGTPNQLVCAGSRSHPHGQIRCHVIERGCFETDDLDIVVHFKRKGYTISQIVPGLFEIYYPDVPVFSVLRE